MTRPSQFSLLKQRRFAPFFWTQFLGAGNDNLFKFAFTVLVTYQWSVDWLPPDLAGLVIGAVFTLPFLLFSATSGQLADRMDKGQLMRAVKNLEIGIMLLGAWGLVAQQPAVLLLGVFLMGLHSTLFGPAKYAYLPQHLEAHELTGGNGMVEMGTFVAILLGNLVGGLLIAVGPHGAQLAAAACLVIAVLGRLAAQWVPTSAPTDPHLRIHWNPFTVTWDNARIAAQDRLVLAGLVGISWMWFFGAVFLTLFPIFAKDVLHGSEAVASGLLVVFSLGIGLGALSCETLSRGRVEIGLCAFGALGMSLFALDLGWQSGQGGAMWRIVLDLFGLSFFTGLYSVPLYALMQWKSPATHRARIVAANNIMNALFMIVSAGWILGLRAWGLSVPEVFMATAILNLLVMGGLMFWQPLFAERAMAGLADGLGRIRPGR